MLHPRTQQFTAKFLVFLGFFVCVCVCTKFVTGVEQLKVNDDVASTYLTVHSQIAFCLVFFLCACVCNKCLTGVEQLKVNNDVASTYSTLLHDDAASRHSPANETQVIYIDIYMKYFHTLYVT